VKVKLANQCRDKPWHSHGPSLLLAQVTTPKTQRLTQEETQGPLECATIERNKTQRKVNGTSLFGKGVRTHNIEWDKMQRRYYDKAKENLGRIPEPPKRTVNFLI